MKLSVIIPVYNGGDDFRCCLAALAGSSQTPEEIIVVDDASTDASGEQASRAGALVVTMKGRPHGPAAARNQGADLAQ
ncbi:MAG TPA: glycosyltransferase family A protein, partial [Anaerolineales bacterium]